MSIKRIVDRRKWLVLVNIDARGLLVVGCCRIIIIFVIFIGVPIIIFMIGTAWF